MNLQYTVDKDTDGKTVKYILKSKLNLSERLVKKLKYNNKILCNDNPVHINAHVILNDIIDVNIDFVEECEDIVPEPINIDIVYEDECMIAINKQPNIVVHPTSGHPKGTIANAVAYYLGKKGIYKKIRPVSRLDRDTTGMIIFAKNQYIQECLIRQMNQKIFKKEYHGIVNGIVKDQSGTIDLPIERKPGSIMLRQVSESGSPSITHFETIKVLNNATYLRFYLETGRTHQIRVHCQAIDHPLIGETLYSDIETDIINRQCLHSHSVSFIHPLTHKEIILNAPIPDDIKRVLNYLEIN